MFFRRNSTRDIELRGRAIREGEKISLWYISANRDESVFDEPFRFDITRDPNPHIAFGGGGPHFCLGAQLARLEIKLLFEELAARVAASSRRWASPTGCARTSSAASSTCRCASPPPDPFRRHQRQVASSAQPTRPSTASGRPSSGTIVPE